MSCMHRLSLVLATFALTWCSTATSHAQGLLWNLPDDGAVVEYAGKYTNKQERPGSNDGPLELEWDSRLTIQSVGEETAEFEGLPTPCRWIEFKLVTGKPSTKGVEADAGIDPGPNGTRIYKVLIPVSKIKGQLRDDDGLPVTYLPIVKGYRKIGQQPAHAVKEKVLAFYPVLGLFANYLDLKPEGEATDLDLPNLGAVKTKMWKGSLKLQNQTSKSENVGEIWLSEDIPFGWAKYHVKLIRQEKDITAAVTAFAPAAEIEVEMTVVKKETSGAKSEIGEVSEETAAPTEEKTEKPAAEKPATEKAEETEKPAAEKTEAAPEKSEM
ncbi:MAG: hypothetical protein JWN70_426 [Planctomycetaceae bacterium]|nr:hypothetical protein [Planctomycetaceae bacterium]